MPIGCTTALLERIDTPDTYLSSKPYLKGIILTECETGICSLDEGSRLFKEPLVQTLLDELPLPTIRTAIDFSFPIAKKYTDRDKLIIAGYGSVEVIDSQNELIPLPVLKEAWERFKANNYFKTGSLMHSNIPVIRVLSEYEDSKGQIWKSGVDDTGLFIVAEVRDDIEKGKQTRDLIEKGALTGFSIGGEALATSVVCEGKCYTRVNKMDLHEIAVVDRPANKPSVFTIVKSERLRKLVELTDILPNLIISPGVAKLGGSIAELGKGHDFDILISAKKGSFVDRAIQTRVHNELRKTDRLDLWNDVQIIHEPEGLGPYTDYYDLYDLVLLRSPLQKKDMILKQAGGGKPNKNLVERLANHFKISEKEAKEMIDKIGPEKAEKLLPEKGFRQKVNNLLLASISKLNKILEKADRCTAAGGEWKTIRGKHVCIISDTYARIRSYDNGKTIEREGYGGKGLEDTDFTEADFAYAYQDLMLGEKVQITGIDLDAESLRDLAGFKVTEISDKNFIVEGTEESFETKNAKELILKQISRNKSGLNKLFLMSVKKVDEAVNLLKVVERHGNK